MQDSIHEEADHTVAKQYICGCIMHISSVTGTFREATGTNKTNKLLVDATGCLVRQGEGISGEC